ncbi:hypothetical protein [Dehalobacterium formicoaceticum]|uniref:hypothetical protein n=1 Tax=Dehalobacterium formicoaceticum TaxID=51515 RepID=UPI001FA8CAD5|nr:hypothetical protein [Dehalobacterium formicoaceticum]
MAVLFKKPQQEQLASFFNKDILNAAQFRLEDIETIMNTAGHYEQLLIDKKVIKDMEGKVMAALFLSPVPGRVCLLRRRCCAWAVLLSPWLNRKPIKFPPLPRGKPFKMPLASLTDTPM